MNEQLQSKLVDILAAIQEAARAGGDFAMAQLPDIAQSYVAYGRVSAVAAVLAGLLVIGTALVVGLRVHDRSEGMVWIPVGAVAAPALLALYDASQSAIFVWVAPKVWLLKEIAGLVK